MTPAEIARITGMIDKQRKAMAEAAKAGRGAVESTRVGRSSVARPVSAPLEQAGQVELQQAKASQPKVAGPGTHLLAMMREIGATACRNCWETAGRMNVWGPDGCRHHRAEIVAEIARNAAAWSLLERLGLAAGAAAKAFAWNLSPLDPYGSLVDEAIRRADVHHGNGPQLDAEAT